MILLLAVNKILVVVTYEIKFRMIYDYGSLNLFRWVALSNLATSLGCCFNCADKSCSKTCNKEKNICKFN